MYNRIFNRVLMGFVALSLAACGSDLTIGDPVADAGDDQRVKTNAAVTFDGSGSSDSDGTIESYVWSEDGVELAASQSYRYQQGFSAGTHTITLTVTDNDGLTSTDTFELIAFNETPTAAVADKTIAAKTHESVELNGNNSFDSDGNIALYAWEYTPPGASAPDILSVSDQPVFQLNTNLLGVGTHVLTLRVTDNDGGTDTESLVITVEQGNLPPVANAGDDQSELGGTVMTLTGSATDDDGTVETYSWDEGATNYGTLATVDLPENLAVGTHIITLTVTDNNGKAGTDTVTVVVENNLPLAAATATFGSDNAPVQGESIVEGEKISFSGVGSSDKDSLLTYLWLDSVDGANGIELGTGVTLESSPALVGAHAVTLKVTDENGGTSNAEVIAFTVLKNEPPVAVAKVDDEVVFGVALILDASESTDDTNNIVSYQWSETDGGVVTIYDTDTAANTVQVSDLAHGLHNITLTVTDNLGQTATADISVTVKNSAPVANAGNNQTVEPGDSVTFDGSGSKDFDGSIQTYVWTTEADVEIGTAVTFTKDDFIEGTHVITLTVTDNDGATADHKVTIVVALNQAPIANAGADQILIPGSAVTFNGSDSADPDVGGSIVSYIWTTVAGGQIGNAVTFTDENLAEGSHVITLTVTDDKGARHSDNVTITLTSSVASGLNDTGINFSGNADVGNNETDCAGGATVAQQDCGHGRDADADANDSTDGHAGFSFIKISSDGTELPVSATEWSCVQDTVSGLIWEVKTNDNDLRDRDWTYVNNSNLSGADAPTADAATCGPLASGGSITCSTESYRANVNAGDLCGASDWRVPTIRELLNLVNYANASPMIDGDYFSDSLGKALWSSSPAVGGGAWAVDFGSAHNGRDPRGDHMAVRLVRDAE